MKRLSIADIKASDILSKEEKRNIMGGDCGGRCNKDSDGGGGGVHRQCLHTECTVTYTDERGSQTSWGKCQQYNISSNTVTCYCDAQPTGDKIVSNGGASRCWA